MAKEERKGILQALDTRTKLLGLISLIAEGLFIGSVVLLPENQVLYALIVCAAILVITILGIVRIETSAHKNLPAALPVLMPSQLTPDSPLLKELIDSAIQTMCRAVSLPQTPEQAKLRVFIFRKERNQLICSHYWAPNPVKEMVGELCFDINAEVAQKVAVVKSVIYSSIARIEVNPLPHDLEGVHGEVTVELSFVLAVPIYKTDGSIWGTIDFDAGNDTGKKLLETEVSDAAMFQLSQHLKVILSLPEEIRAGNA